MWISVIVTLAILLTISPLWDDDESQGGRRSQPPWIDDPESYYPTMPGPEFVAVGSAQIDTRRGETWARTRARSQARTRMAHRLSMKAGIVDVELKGIRDLAQWRSPDGRLYVLLGLPRS